MLCAACPGCCPSAQPKQRAPARAAAACALQPACGTVACNVRPSLSSPLPLWWPPCRPSPSRPLLFQPPVPSAYLVAASNAMLRSFASWLASSSGFWLAVAWQSETVQPEPALSLCTTYRSPPARGWGVGEGGAAGCSAGRLGPPGARPAAAGALCPSTPVPQAPATAAAAARRLLLLAGCAPGSGAPRSVCSAPRRRGATAQWRHPLYNAPVPPPPYLPSPSPRAPNPSCCQSR
jgi:hypothetical protein